MSCCCPVHNLIGMDFQSPPHPQDHRQVRDVDHQPKRPCERAQTTSFQSLGVQWCAPISGNSRYKSWRLKQTIRSPLKKTICFGLSEPSPPRGSRSSPRRKSSAQTPLRARPNHLFSVSWCVLARAEIRGLAVHIEATETDDLTLIEKDDFSPIEKDDLLRTFRALPTPRITVKCET